jgi:hypothetical protein
VRDKDLGCSWAEDGLSNLQNSIFNLHMILVKYSSDLPVIVLISDNAGVPAMASAKYEK